ncbi:MAG: ABC transporter permease [Bradyrhizobium sp.]|nr:ABC transporter permease [Bradyrhizobium sp.]
MAIGKCHWFPRSTAAALVERSAIWIVLLCLLIAMALLSDAFHLPAFLGNIVRQMAPVGMAAIGVTYVMVLGGIDLSVGAVISLAAVLCAVEMDGKVANIPWAVLVTLLAGMAIGLVNGALVAFSRASPFILTLGSSLAVYGLTQIYSGGTARGIVAAEFRDVFNYRVGGVAPVLALAFLLAAILAAQVLRRSRYGRILYLVGSNPRAARTIGLPIESLTLGTYALSGAFAAAGGIALLARSGVSSTFAGRGLEFDVLAAVVLGGTTFEGGSGGIGGTVAGMLVLFIAFSIVNIAGLNYNAQLIIKGTIIVAASAAYAFLKRGR